jgi:hypothetical protein
MHGLHESVEMRTLLGRERQAVVQDIHEHGLAAADAAPQINATHPVPLAPPHESGEPVLSGTMPACQVGVEAVETLDGFALARIDTALAGRNRLLVSREGARRRSGSDHGCVDNGGHGIAGLAHSARNDSSNVMAQIRQVQVSFAPVEDRLLLRFNTAAGEEFRFWMTRRYVRILRPVLDRLLGADPVIAGQSSDDARRTVLSFRHEQAISKADFSRAFDATTTRCPLGDTPVLLARVQLKTGTEGHQILCLHPERGAGVEIALTTDLAHSLVHLVADAVRKAQWDLPVPAIAGPPPSASQHRTIN